MNKHVVWNYLKFNLTKNILHGFATAAAVATDFGVFE